MERISPKLLVDPAMPSGQREKLKRDIATATSEAKAWFGTFELIPTVVACSTDVCDRRLGGRGAKATTYSTPFGTVIRVAPQGMNRTILTHEFAHVELHRKIGLVALLGGRLPAWFDEGLASIVSKDPRYVKPGLKMGCVSNRNSDLPTSPSEWGIMAGKDKRIYADAACRVLQWMDKNGGRMGVLAMLEGVGKGGRFTP